MRPSSTGSERSVKTSRPLGFKELCQLPERTIAMCFRYMHPHRDEQDDVKPVVKSVDAFESRKPVVEPVDRGVRMKLLGLAAQLSRWFNGDNLVALASKPRGVSSRPCPDIQHQ